MDILDIDAGRPQPRPKCGIDRGKTLSAQIKLTERWRIRRNLSSTMSAAAIEPPVAEHILGNQKWRPPSFGDHAPQHRLAELIGALPPAVIEFNSCIVVVARRRVGAGEHRKFA